MNITDVVILVLGSYFVIRGAFRGFSGEIFSLVSIFGGFYCALSFYPPIAETLTEYLGISMLASSACAMLAIFVLIFALFAWLDKGVKKFLKVARLSGIDKFFGAVAGVAKIYVVALLLLVMGVIASPVTGDEWMSESKTLIATAKTWPVLYPILDDAGLIPDLASIQRDAGDYIMSLAHKKLFGSGEPGKPDEMGKDEDGIESMSEIPMPDEPISPDLLEEK